MQALLSSATRSSSKLHVGVWQTSPLKTSLPLFPTTRKLICPCPPPIPSHPFPCTPLPKTTPPPPPPPFCFCFSAILFPGFFCTSDMTVIASLSLGSLVFSAAEFVLRFMSPRRCEERARAARGGNDRLRISGFAEKGLSNSRGCRGRRARGH